VTLRKVKKIIFLVGNMFSGEIGKVLTCGICVQSDILYVQDDDQNCGIMCLIQK
jgi:hypothetical protein